MGKHKRHKVMHLSRIALDKHATQELLEKHPRSGYYDQRNAFYTRTKMYAFSRLLFKIH